MIKNSLFNLGKVVATSGSLRTIKKLIKDDTSLLNMAIECLLQKHAILDPGELCQEDQETNMNALRTGERIFSSYNFNDEKIWIITEADRSVTTILLPEEY